MLVARVVSIHREVEYQPGANGRQRVIAQALADAGVAVIWGHHPQVRQPFAWVQGYNQALPTLVIYSLGNALFNQAPPPYTRRSAVLLVTLNNSGIRSIKAIPFEIDPLAGRVMEGSRVNAQIVTMRLGKIIKP